MSRNTEIIEAFIAAWNRKDIEAVMRFFSDDCVYHNMPVAAVEGTRAIRAVIDGFTGMASEIHWELHQVAENAAGVVLTERTDKFLIGEKWIALPVMGSFEFRADKICAWRDYFDMAQFQSQLPG